MYIITYYSLFFKNKLSYTTPFYHYIKNFFLFPTTILRRLKLTPTLPNYTILEVMMERIAKIIEKIHYN